MLKIKSNTNNIVPNICDNMFVKISIKNLDVNAR